MNWFKYIYPLLQQRSYLIALVGYLLLVQLIYASNGTHKEILLELEYLSIVYWVGFVLLEIAHHLSVKCVIDGSVVVDKKENLNEIKELEARLARLKSEDEDRE